MPPRCSSLSSSKQGTHLSEVKPRKASFGIPLLTLEKHGTHWGPSSCCQQDLGKGGGCPLKGHPGEAKERPEEKLTLKGLKGLKGQGGNRSPESEGEGGIRGLLPT